MSQFYSNQPFKPNYSTKNLKLNLKCGQICTHQRHLFEKGLMLSIIFLKSFVIESPLSANVYDVIFLCYDVFEIYLLWFLCNLRCIMVFYGLITLCKCYGINFKKFLVVIFNSVCIDIGISYWRLSWHSNNHPISSRKW